MPASARLLRCALPLAIALVASCSTTSQELASEPPPTSILVQPGAFLGHVSCGDRDGEVARYQASLIDVTDGLDEASPVTSSPVVSCRQSIGFESVEAGRSYIAQIALFDRIDARAQAKGAPVVVDQDGNMLGPVLATTCWGYDDVDYAELLGGGGAPASDEEATSAAGAGGAPNRLGVLSVDSTEVPVRGCDPLDARLDPLLTGIAVDVRAALGGLRCGSEPGEIHTFTIGLPSSMPEADPDEEPDPSGLGGAGGATGQGGQGGAGPVEPTNYPCGEEVVFRGLSPGTYLSFPVSASGADGASYRTTCRASLTAGVIVPVSCDLLLPD